MNIRDNKIFVGDSDPESLSRIKQMLLEEEFAVWTSEDAGETVRILNSGEFDLVIIDIKIYVQLVHQNFNIGSRGEGQTPIIILTTDEDFEVAMAVVEEAAVDFLDKPVRVKRLLITVRNALEHSSKLQQIRKDQEELSSLKELYEHIINGIDYGLVVLDKDLRIVSLNRNEPRRDQRNDDEVIGEYCYDYFYNREAVCDECEVKEVFEKGIPVKYNIANKTVGGKSFHLEVEAFPLFNKNGEVIQAVQLIKDVTDRIQLEKELREKKEHLESLVAHAPIGIFTTDNEGYIETANPAFVELSGTDPTGMNVLKAENFKKAGVDDAFNHVLREGKPFEIEGIRCGQLDKEKICSIRSVPLRGVGEEITGLIATVADVTEKWALEESYKKRITELSIFREIGELLQSNTNLDDIYSIALIGVTAGKGLGFNRAFLLRYDRNESKLYGVKAIGPSDKEEAWRIWMEIYEKNLSLNQLFEDYKSDQSDKDVKVNAIIKILKIPITWEEGFLHEVLFKNVSLRIGTSEAEEHADQKMITEAIGCDTFAVAPLISRGRAEGLIIADNLITGEEITEEDVDHLSIITTQAGAAIENSILLKNLEEKIEALRQTYTDLKENRDLLWRAERLSVVGEVAASVAHEIRNPLTSIGGFTRAVLRDLEVAEKITTNKRFLTIILEEVKRLERIVSETLEFVRPVMPKFEYADVNEVVEQTFNMMAGEINEDQVVTTKDYQDGLEKIWMDTDQIRQVLLNIFRNAIHAMEDAGMLSVITEGDSENVRIHISDTGHGIAEENKNKLFTAFFTTKSTGSGLGLTVSAQIIKKHGGSIEVESQEGGGSTFLITLPVHTKEEINAKENSSSRR